MHNLSHFLIERGIERSISQANSIDDFDLSELGVDKKLYIREVFGLQSGGMLYKGIKGVNGVALGGKYLVDRNDWSSCDSWEYWDKQEEGKS